MRDLRNITALILAGGLGTRLREEVADRPKVLAQVGGRPFLAYLLDQLKGHGVGQVVLCTGYRGEMVRETFDSEYGGMELVYSPEESALGTGGAICPALELTRAEQLLVINGDSYCDAHLTRFVQWCQARNTAAGMVLAKVPDSSRFGAVTIDEAGFVTAFSEKNKETGPGLINAGIYLFTRDFIGSFPPSRPLSLENEIFPTLIDNGLCGWVGAGGFIDIGTPESYTQAGEFIRKVGQS